MTSTLRVNANEGNTANNTSNVCIFVYIVMSICKSSIKVPNYNQCLQIITMIFIPVVCSSPLVLLFFQCYFLMGACGSVAGVVGIVVSSLA